MADLQPSKVNMADDDLPLIHRQRGNRSTRRGWRCPDDAVVAAYMDGVVDAASRSRIESHLTDCPYCRSLVADVVTMQRFDAPALPLGLTQRAIALLAPKSRRGRWIVVPAVAMAGATFVVIATLVLRSPQQVIVPNTAAPAAPVLAKSEPAPTLSPPVADMVRKLASAAVLPSVVSPRPDKAVQSDQLEFKWKAVPRSRYYEIHVVTSEGDLVWEGQSEEPVLRLPGDVTLKDGPYFVWISAYLTDGRVQKSGTVRFQVAASR